MKTIGNIVLWTALGVCAYNALFSILGAILLYIIVGAITQTVIAPLNHSNFMKALSKHPDGEKLLADRTAVNLGFALSFFLGIFLWPTHISSIVNAPEGSE